MIVGLSEKGVVNCFVVFHPSNFASLNKERAIFALHFLWFEVFAFLRAFFAFCSVYIVENTSIKLVKTTKNIYILTFLKKCVKIV